LPKISQAMGDVEKFFLPISKSLSPLGCQGWVVCYTSKSEKIPNHCTLHWTCRVYPISPPAMWMCRVYSSSLLAVWTCRVNVPIILNVGMPDCLASGQSGTKKKCRCRNQSGTGIRGPSSVSGCCGTGLRDQMPECRCRQHRHRRCPAMLFIHTCNIVRIILNPEVWRPIYIWAKQGAGE